MVLAVDLLRYWLHRFAHENDTLWRLHSVHHSVEQLYWLNTARFHPIEKTLQMSLDSLPFLLLGVHEQVLALYYIAYAANGFFQHCNVHVRYGPLNYIVGSAETHRWHHSRVPRESNANYGNTVIVWDSVRDVVPAEGSRDPGSRAAGTRLSEDVSRADARAVQAVGAPVQSAVLRAGMLYSRLRHWRRSSVSRTGQTRHSGRCWRGQSAPTGTRVSAGNTASTPSATIRTSRRGCRCRSSRRWPYIDEQRKTGAPALTAEPPVFTRRPAARRASLSTFRSRRRCSRCTATSRRFLYLQYRACPAAFAGKAFGIMGAAVEGHLDSGHLVGSVSGHLYQSLPRSVRSRFVVPPDVLGIADYDLEVLHHPAPCAERTA